MVKKNPALKELLRITNEMKAAINDKYKEIITMEATGKPNNELIAAYHELRTLTRELLPKLSDLVRELGTQGVSGLIPIISGYNDEIVTYTRKLKKVNKRLTELSA